MSTHMESAVGLLRSAESHLKEHVKQSLVSEDGRLYEAGRVATIGMTLGHLIDRLHTTSNTDEEFRTYAQRYKEKEDV